MLLERAFALASQLPQLVQNPITYYFSYRFDCLDSHRSLLQPLDINIKQWPGEVFSEPLSTISIALTAIMMGRRPLG